MKRYFYGWVIAGCAFFTLLVTNGLTFAGITVFDESMLREFGWSRGTLKFRDLLTMGLAGLLSPLAGAIADKYGVKRLMAFGAATLVAALLLYGQVGSALQMYLVHVMFAVVLASCGIVMAVILVSRWFVAKRGTATGIAMVGTSMGGALFPALGGMLVGPFGWRSSLMVYAIFPAVLLAVILLLVRERPGDMGLKPLGADGPARPGAPPAGLDYRDAIRTRTFWLIAAAGSMTFYAILGISSHVFLYLRGQGFDVQTAARGLSWMFLMGLTGKFLFGYLADLFDHKRVLLVNLGLMFAGSLALASMNTDLFWPFVILFGLGWGGIYTLLQLLTMDAFGLKAAGRVLGTRTVVDALGGGLGPWVTGWLFDRTGSYQVPFLLVSGLILLTLLISTILRIHPPASEPAGTRV
ncbi:MAG: MFS transporter [Vicinamibacterales bacterium]|jgi:MFS family permease|nr:MFS transporter [Vicinamibacterales bacterium]